MHDLFKLIEASHSAEKAAEFRDFNPNQRDLLAALAAAEEVLNKLTLIPPGFCGPLSAIYWYTFAKYSDKPLYVIAGDLVAGNTRVFGENKSTDEIASVFNSSNPSWDGHCWAQLGSHVIDVSVAVTVDSGKAHAQLEEYFRRNFDPDEKIVMGDVSMLEHQKLSYIPKYVLTDEQIEGVALAGQEYLMDYMKKESGVK